MFIQILNKIKHLTVFNKQSIETNKKTKKNDLPVFKFKKYVFINCIN